VQAYTSIPFGTASAAKRSARTGASLDSGKPLILSPKSRRTDFIRSVGALLGPTRVAPGCIGCRLYADFENVNAFTLVEEWASQQRWAVISRPMRIRHIVAAIELLAEPSTIHFDTVGQGAGFEVIEAARRSRGLL
jgi:quinol monooxygenase YgiN